MQVALLAARLLTRSTDNEALIRANDELAMTNAQLHDEQRERIETVETINEEDESEEVDQDNSRIIDTLRDHVERLGNENRQLEERNNRLNQEMMNMASELEESTNRYSDLMTENSRLGQVESQLQKTLSGLEHKLDSTEEYSNQLEERIDQLEKSNQSVKSTSFAEGDEEVERVRGERDALLLQNQFLADSERRLTESIDLLEQVGHLMMALMLPLQELNRREHFAEEEKQKHVDNASVNG
jgi:chromosome segregation ATPase